MELNLRKRIIQVIGGANLLAALLGFCWFGVMLVLSSWRNTASGTEWLKFSMLSLFNVALLAWLSHLGVRLLRLDERAIRLTILALVVEAVSWWIFVPVLWVLSSSSLVMGFFMAESLLDPQIVTAYPLLGSILLLFLEIGRRGKQHVSSVSSGKVAPINSGR